MGEVLTSAEGGFIADTMVLGSCLSQAPFVIFVPVGI